MSKDDISDAVQHFIFNYIDSVEQLEVLLFLRSNTDKFHSVQEISNNIRTNPSSITNRVTGLLAVGLVSKDTSDPPLYNYHPKDPEKAKLVEELAELYKTRRHRIYELMYSSLTKMNSFANSFIVRPKKDGGDNG